MPSQGRRLKKRSFQSGAITKKRPCRSGVMTTVDANANIILTRRSSARKTRKICTPPETFLTNSLYHHQRQQQSVPELKLGFILGEQLHGCQILNNLVHSGHKFIVCLLDFTEEFAHKFMILGVEIVSSPLEVWRKADLIFSFSASANHAKALIFGENSLLQELNPTKYFVEMTCIDANLSNEIDSAMKSYGVKYLEAQLQGSVKEAASGYLIILTAGNETLFQMCQTCFEAIGCQSFFFGSVGSACTINLSIKMMTSICIAGLAQGLALAKQFGFRIDDVLKVIDMTNLSSRLIMDKGRCMLNGQYQPEMSLNQMQRDLSSLQRMAEEVQHPIPIASTVNEKFKECILLGLGAQDVSAIFQTF